MLASTMCKARNALSSALWSHALSGDVCWCFLLAITLLCALPFSPGPHVPLDSPSCPRRATERRGKEAGHAAGHIDLVTQDVFPAVAELEQLARMGHPCRQEGRDGWWSVGCLPQGQMAGMGVTCCTVNTHGPAVVTPPGTPSYSQLREDTAAYEDGPGSGLRNFGRSVTASVCQS